MLATLLCSLSSSSMTRHCPPVMAASSAMSSEQISGPRAKVWNLQRENRSNSQSGQRETTTHMQTSLSQEDTLWQEKKGTHTSCNCLVCINTQYHLCEFMRKKAYLMTPKILGSKLAGILRCSLFTIHYKCGTTFCVYESGFLVWFELETFWKYPSPLSWPLTDHTSFSSHHHTWLVTKCATCRLGWMV